MIHYHAYMTIKEQSIRFGVPGTERDIDPDNSNPLRVQLSKFSEALLSDGVTKVVTVEDQSTLNIKNEVIPVFTPDRIKTERDVTLQGEQINGAGEGLQVRTGRFRKTVYRYYP
jgi:hypothetical protein